MPTLVPRNATEHVDIMRGLLEAAGPRASEVRTVTHGPRLAFDVPDDIHDAYLKATVKKTPKKREA